MPNHAFTRQYKTLLLSVGLALLTVSCASPPAETTEAAEITETTEIAEITETTEDKTDSLAAAKPTTQKAPAVSQAESPRSLASSASNVELPVATESGDFVRRTLHSTWKVVDSDPEGLNCRWSPDMPELWYSPGADWPNSDFFNWPVERTFAYGTVLTSNGTPIGMMNVIDSRGLPWLKIQLEEQDQICLVRANSSYIEPIP